MNGSDMPTLKVYPIRWLTLRQLTFTACMKSFYAVLAPQKCEKRFEWKRNAY